MISRDIHYRHNIMLLWFVKIYERNLKKLQFTTQRFDTPVWCLHQGSGSLAHKHGNTRPECRNVGS